MHVGGLRNNQSKYDHSLTATVMCARDRGTINLSGMFLIAHGFSAEFYFTEGDLSHDPPTAFFLHGPNPPPPPPACATSTGAANQSACNAVKPSNGGVGPACAWCESKDGVHGGPQAGLNRLGLRSMLPAQPTRSDRTQPVAEIRSP